ncbi:MAG: ribokinase [Synergistaceae bacterium]|nr:ribokinase [Synergistaceae bacterium]
MKNILVIGSLNMDIVTQVDRIPVAGETVLGDDLRYSCGGKGANQAFAIGKFEGSAEMLGCVGKDGFGEEIIRNLASVGVKVDAIGRSESLKTGTAIINVEKSGNNNIVVIPGANKSCDEAYLRANDALFKKCDYILLQMEIPEEAVWYAINRGKELGRTIILNPAPAPDSLPADIMPKLDYIIPNESELVKLCGCDDDSMNEIKRGAQKLINMGVNTVIVTLGDKGGVLVQRDLFELFPPIPVRAVDTTAAGDCFCAAFVVALANDQTLHEAITFAKISAGLAVTKQGAQNSIPDRLQIEEYRISKN